MQTLVAPPDEVVVQDVDYLEQAGAPLLARLYLPSGRGPFPLVCEVHGGAWCRGSRLDEDLLNRTLARHGIAVAALDFRMPPEAAYPASVADIHYGLRWFRAHAPKWRIDPARVGLMGVSSGGHLAILAAMRPNDPRYAARALAGAAVDPRPAFAVLCWPVIDPLGRFHYAKALQASGQPYPQALDRVIPDHLKYWPDEAAMSEGSPLAALERGESVNTPPVLYLQGDADRVHPRDHLDRFAQAYRRAGGRVSVRLFEGEVEGFINRMPDSPAALAAVRAIVEFIQGETPTNNEGARHDD